MNPSIDFNAIAEAQRRMGGMPSSSAGIPGGSQVANSQSPTNPIAQQGVANAPTNPLAEASSPTGENASSGAVKALNNALPTEANDIIKALTKTLDRLTNGLQSAGV
jgi:hypothetical protein